MFATLIIIFSFTSCFKDSDERLFENSNKTLAKEIFSIVDYPVDHPLEINNCPKMYEQLNQFLTSEECDEVINKYYGTVFKSDSKQEAYARVYGFYDAVLLHLRKYEEFQVSIKQNADKYYGEQYEYSMALWEGLLASPEDV